MCIRDSGSNTDKTFYDSSGKILGYSFSWSNDDGSSGTGYNDANWNWLGDSFSDPANGYSSSFSSVEIKDSDGKVTGYQEKGTSKQIDTTTSAVLFERKWDFEFDASWTFVKGTEQEGIITTTYGANWEVTKVETDTSALPKISDTTGIPSALLDSPQANTKISVKKFSDSDSETTYFDSSGNILGTSFTWSDTANGMSGTSYNDSNWNYLGGSFTDSTNGFSNSNFSTTTYAQDGKTVTGYVDSGTDTQTDPDTGAVLFSRSYEYTFDDSYELVSGTETENGVVITYGANWEITGRKASVFTDGKLNSGFSEVSSDDLSALPTALQAASGKTYQSSETHGNNTDKTFYDSSGKV